MQPTTEDWHGHSGPTEETTMGKITMKHWSMTCLSILGCSAALHGALAQTVVTPFPASPPDPNNMFMRMFPDLPSFAEQSDSARRAAQLLGTSDGMFNAEDNLTDPIQSILNPAVFSPHNPDNPNMTAGVTFLGQFLDHDLTLDRNSLLNENAAPEKTLNFRTAAFDLDSLYGFGPKASPQFYDMRSGRIKFIVQAIPGSEAVSRHGAVRNDAPETPDGETWSHG